MKKTIVYIALVLTTLASVSACAQKEDPADNMKTADFEYKQNNYKRAAELYSAVLEQDSNSTRALFKRGMCYLFLTQFRKALDDFNKYIELDSTNADAFNSRGLVYGYLGYSNRALDNFSAAIALDSNFAQAYLNRGSGHLVFGNFIKAQIDLDAAVRLDPSNPENYYQRGILRYKTEDYEKAAADYKKCLELGLVSPEILYKLGNTMYKLEKYAEAADYYSQTLDRDPSHNQALNNRAMSYDKAGETELAERDRQKLREIAESRYPPIEEIEFKKYECAKGGFSIELPASWHVLAYSTGESEEMIISLEKIASENQPYKVGVKLSMNRNMSERYEVKTQQDVINMWDGSAAKNAESYHNYRIFTKKTTRFGDWHGFINYVILQITAESFPLKMYEFGVAKNDDLLYGYFQAPDKEFEYYKQIFDKSLKTLTIK